jgi:ribonucleotide reductase beta subunit family protein with ferritin-like domain
MAVIDEIQRYVQRLPKSFQAEVLDYVEYLLDKAQREEEKEWSGLSLANAMRGMDAEDTATYSVSDLKVKFS